MVAPGDLAYVTKALADAIACHESHGRRTPVTAAYGRILALLAGRVPASVRQLSPGAASVAGTGLPGGLAGAVEALDGSERKLLLARLADADPAVVAAGFAWLADYHAANAERARVNRNRRAKERRRRTRADGN